MMLPVSAGPMPAVEVHRSTHRSPTTLRAELRVSRKPDNHTPDVVLKVLDIPLPAGHRQRVPLDFASLPSTTPGYAFVCLIRNENISVHLSDQRLTGVIALCQTGNKAVAKSNIQSPPPGIGIDTFEFWTPKRRPLGKNLALRICAALCARSPRKI